MWLWACSSEPNATSITAPPLAGPNERPDQPLVAIAEGQRHRVELGEVLLAQLQVGRRAVLRQVAGARRAGDGQHVPALGQGPGDRDLARCRAVAPCGPPDDRQEGLVALDRL